ncbi:DUF3365 domain-containing protein [Gammaproteobacteria bacterium]
MSIVLKKKLLAASLGLLALGVAMANPQESYLAEARMITKKFSMALKKKFFTAIQDAQKAKSEETGAVSAITTCHIKAPSVSQDISRSSGWSVGRTSLKLRNPKNQPDDWEAQVLRRFEERQQAGENPDKIEFSEVVTHGDKKEFRYMKAIPTITLCLNCHGTEIKPEIQAAFKQFYPQDHATGFKVGDLRGAFTLCKAL